MHMPRPSLSVSLSRLSRPAYLMLIIGLPYIAAHLLVIAWLFCRRAVLSPYYAALRYTPQVEALLCTLMVLIIGAALFDWLDKSYRQ